MPLTPGSTFERYEIQTLIGRGGMGEVYRAVDTRLNRSVALKVLRTDKDALATVAEAGGVARLLREARAAAALNHANSVAIYELGEAEGIAYIAMELVTGVTFRRYLGEGNVSVDTKVTWLVDAARALWAAHKAGLVHRDVKPGNIMVSDEGIVKVLDFGLAKAVAVNAAGANPAEFQTLLGQVLGTPRYMAPEQLEGAPADASADQFAFGLTAYELLSGVYAGGPLAGQVAPVETLVPDVSRELGAAVARMMARKAADRFPTMEAAAHALRTCLSGPTTRQGRVGAGPTGTAPLRQCVEEPRAATAGKGARASDASTIVQSAEPTSRARELPATVASMMAKGSTLPLGMPMKMAMGDSSAAQVSGANMNKTMPLARPITIPEPLSMQARAPSAVSAVSAVSAARLAPPTPESDRRGAPISNPGLLPGAPSGVYAARRQSAEDALQVTGARRSGREPARAEAPRRAWVPLVTIAVAAAAVGGVAAWFLS